MGLFPDGPAAGKIIGGKYRLEKKLSEGGGGIVWEARNHDGEKIALKFLKWSPLKSKGIATERFKNEFSILKSLSHPNISKIHDFGRDIESDLYFFTSELLTEGDLRTHIKSPIPIIEGLLIQALRSLEYLGNHRLLHLDIKPQNLLLRQGESQPILAIIDFGLATFRSPDKPGGTANYMPPELIVKRLNIDPHSFPPPDPRSDLYSLGVTFYYCLTGVQPFCARTKDGKRVDPQETLKMHLSFDPPPPSAHRPDIPPYLDRIIMKLMARHPDDRYPSAIVAAQALQYSSPRHYEPETCETLLAYLPKEGKIIGRHDERSAIEDILRAAATGEGKSVPIICIAGGRGCGRSRLLRAAKPFAQRMEMDAILIDDANQSIPALWGKNNSCALLIDDIDLHFDGEAGQGVIHSLKTYVKRLEFQHRLPTETKGRSLMIFTVNTDRTDPKKAMSKLGIDHSICRILVLKNFNSSEVKEYLTSLLGEMPDRSVIDQLMRCTDGNPLFITEHLEQMIARGRLFSLAGRPDAKTLKTIGIDFSQVSPSRSLANSVLGQLSALPEDARNLALTLACWHRPASPDELRTTSDLNSIDKELLLLTGCGIIGRKSKDGRFAFSNDLSPRIIMDNSSSKQLAGVHDRIAAYLRQRRRAGRGDMLLHIAYGSPSAKTLPALMELADEAIDEHRLFDAISHLKKMLTHLPQDSWKRRAEILAKTGETFERMHRLDDAKSYYKKLANLKTPRKLGIELKLRSAEYIGRMEIRLRKLDQARRIFNEALKLAGRKRSLVTWRLRIENYLAGIDLRDGRLEDAVDRFERSDQVAKKVLAKSESLAITNNELGEALLRSGDVPRALKILKNELKAAEQSGDFERVAGRHYLLGNALRHDSICQYDDAKGHYLEGLNLARKHRMLNLEVRLENGLGNLYLRTSKPREAMKHYRNGFRLSQQVDSYTTSVELMIGMGLAAQRLGDPDGTIEYFEAALDFSGGPKGVAAGLIRRYRPTIYVSLGDAYYQRQDLPSAIEYLEKARQLDESDPFTPDLRYSLYGTYTEIMLAYEDREAAEKYMPMLAAIAKSFPPAQRHLSQLRERMRQ